VDSKSIESWNSDMDRVVSAGNFLARCNAIDVPFLNGERLECFIALSQSEKSRGLANLPELEVDGMLFIYQIPSYAPFSVQDMLFDLDIAFYDVKGKLLKVTTAVAGDSNPVYAPAAYSYVLEAPVGTVPQADLQIRT